MVNHELSDEHEQPRKTVAEFARDVIGEGTSEIRSLLIARQLSLTASEGER